MMRLVPFSAAVGVSIGLSTTVAGQAPSTPRLAPVELGVGVDATWLRAGLFLDEPVVAGPMMHVRATQPITRKLAIEGIFGMSRWFTTKDVDYRTEALYAIQIKQNIWRGTRGGFFVTYGAAGSWTRVLVYNQLTPPFCLTAGGGFQWEIARRAALRVDTQGVLFAGFFPMGGRLSTGVSIPLGSYR
jgi:hypothetical protein